jgi:hypothetical protein
MRFAVWFPYLEQRIMSDLSNSPVIPVLSPRGWTPQAQVRFLEHLAAKGNVRAACARVGLSAEAAYRLRRRDPLFARGWAAAVVMARTASEDALATRALDGVEEPGFYRGEQIGVRQRYDTRLLLAHLARLDRMVAQNRAAVQDAGRFDEMLALIAGEAFPEELAGQDALLPLPREEWASEAQERLFAAHDSEDDSEEDDVYGVAFAEEQAEEQALWEASQAARQAAEADWDAWFARACQTVDRACERASGAGEREAESAVEPAIPGGDVLTPSAAASGSGGAGAAFRACGERPDEMGAGDDEKGSGTRYPAGPAFARVPEIVRIGAGLRTVSTVSTSALTQALAGPVRHFAPAGHPAFHARRG